MQKRHQRDDENVGLKKTAWIFEGDNKNFVRPEKFQFLEKGQNRNFDYKIVISVKNLKFIL